MYIKKVIAPIVALFLVTVLLVAIPAVAPIGTSGWKFRADLGNTGVYDNGGIEPGNQELWSFPTSDDVISSPTVINGVVYFGSWDYNVYAVYANDGTMKWSYPTENWVSSSPAVVDSVVYVASYDGNLYALNADTGAYIWASTIGGTNAWTSSSPAVADGVVYVGTHYNGFWAIDAATGDTEWHFTAVGAVLSSPAVANGVIYFGSEDNKVYALNADGTEKWSYLTGGAVDSSPAVANGVVYIGSYDGNVYALNADNGDFIWSYPTGNWVSSSPAVGNGVVYVGSWNKKVYALNADTGLMQWEFETGAEIQSSPAVANGVVYIGSYDNKVYAINAGTGAKIWEFTTSSTVFSSPAVANGVVYVGSSDGNVYAIGNQAPPNQAPTANAGPDQTAIVRSKVTLDGRGSSDPDNDPLTYAWTIVSKPQLSTATLSNPTSAQPTLKPDRMGTYVLQLVVNDGKVDSAPDTVTITVNPTKATVLQDLATLKTTVNSLPNSAFTPGGKIGILNAINVATLQVKLGKYEDAAKTLQWVLTRTDGCHNSGVRPDWNDLVKTCNAQGQLYPQVGNLIQEVKALQGS